MILLKNPYDEEDFHYTYFFNYGEDSKDVQDEVAVEHRSTV